MINIKYIAGFWDGEGSITIQKQKFVSKYKTGVQHFLFVKASNTNKQILEEIKNYFKVGTITSNGKIKKNCRQAWQYQSSANDAYKIIKELYPHLIIKKEVAKLAMEFQKTMDANKKRCMKTVTISQEILDVREYIKNKISGLNKGTWLENCEGWEERKK